MKTVIALASMFSILLVGGCWSGLPSLDEPGVWYCETVGDCADGYSCVGGFCQTAERLDSQGACESHQCAGEQTCVVDGDGVPHCEAACGTPADCSGDMYWTDGNGTLQYTDCGPDGNDLCSCIVDVTRSKPAWAAGICRPYCSGESGTRECPAHANHLCAYVDGVGGGGSGNYCVMPMCVEGCQSGQYCEVGSMSTTSCVEGCVANFQCTGSVALDDGNSTVLDCASGCACVLTSGSFIEISTYSGFVCAETCSGGTDSCSMSTAVCTPSVTDIEGGSAWTCIENAG